MTQSSSDSAKKAETRDEKRARALRENLRKRKEQAKSREELETDKDNQA